MRKEVLVAIAVILLAGACSKGNGSGDDGSGSNGPHILNTQDTIPPVVEILTPTQNQLFRSGDNITVTGKVTDGDGLYQGSIRITNVASGNTVKEQLYVIHGITSYDFSVSHTVSVTGPADYTVTVLFEDHGLNKTSKSVSIKVTQ